MGREIVLATLLVLLASQPASAIEPVLMNDESVVGAGSVASAEGTWAIDRDGASNSEGLIELYGTVISCPDCAGCWCNTYCLLLCDGTPYDYSLVSVDIDLDSLYGQSWRLTGQFGLCPPSGTTFAVEDTLRATCLPTATSASSWGTVKRIFY